MPTILSLLLALLVQDDLEETLRKLEKDISAVRGLAFKTPVRMEKVERPEGQNRKIQGYYSTQQKKLYLYDDIRGSYQRGVLIHEMVHALQDQHFGLGKLHQEAGGSDRDLALSALIEGDATLTMIELLKDDQPRVADMLDAELAKSRNLRNAFLYAQGARYVRALREEGGWEAVNRAYANPPRCTAAVLHPGERISGIRVGPGKVRGEYGILSMLLKNPETKSLAVEAAAGWRGDAEAEHGPSRAWTVLFDRKSDAREFQEAMAALREADDPDLRAFLDETRARAWFTGSGGVRAVLARGRRAYVLEAPDAAAFDRLLDRLDSPHLSIRVYSAAEKKHITFGEFVDRLMEADVICVGESHTSEPHHRLQLHVIKALFARDESLGVGMEMFFRPFQEPIDRYFAGEMTEKEFLEATEYRKRWGFDWRLYRPIVEFSRRNGIPLAALNAPKELTSRISKVGLEGLSDEERAQLPDIDLDVKEHRDYWFERLARMHGGESDDEDQKERSYQVMAVWDGVMASSAAHFLRERRLRRLVVLAGSGHVDRRFGIPDRTARRIRGKVLTVRITSPGLAGKETSDPVADFVVVIG